MTENDIREKMLVHGKSLFERRFTCGGSGNMSAPLFLMLRNENCAVLDHDAVEELRKRFG